MKPIILQPQPRHASSRELEDKSHKAFGSGILLVISSLLRRLEKRLAARAEN